MRTDIDLELVREMAFDADGPDPATRQRARDAFLAAAGQHPETTARPGLNRRRGSSASGPGARRFALSAVLAGTLAAGVVAVSALLPSRTAHESSLGPTPASAAVVLDRAANTALSKPAVFPTASQYEYLKVQEGSTSSIGRGDVGIRFWQSDTKQDWSKPNGSGRERIRIVDSRQGLLTPLDRSIARAHGISLAQFMPSQDRDWTYPAGMPGFWSIYSPAGLPTQPAGLLRAIKRELRARTRTPPTAADVFNVISERLLFASNSPTLRAALYRVIAHLPGVQLLGWQTDRIGRRGIAVTISHVEVGDEGTRAVLLFDPATSDVLQTQLIQVGPLRDYNNTPPLPAGTVLRYTTFIGRGIVNSIDDLPGGGRLPYYPH